jgi:hypothetical protein
VHIPKQKADGEIKISWILLKTKIYSWYAKWTDNSFYPTNKIRIPVDKDAIIKKQGCFASIL